MIWTQIGPFIHESDNFRFRVVHRADRTFSTWIRDKKFRKFHRVLGWVKLRDKPYETLVDAKEACENEEDKHQNLGPYRYWKDLRDKLSERSHK